MDRKAERELRAYLDGLGSDAQIVRDLEGPAVYQLAPTWATAILCVHCRYIGLVMSLPRRPLTWSCSRCDRSVRQVPPLQVLVARSPSTGEPGRHRLS
jgi:hypothetical protein